jgi:large subunit ribosomal protein L29
MTGEELRVLDREELEGQLKTSRRELYELRFKLAVGQLDDHRQIRKVRHDIARILTSMRQRELGLVTEEAVAGAATAVATAAVAPAAIAEEDEAEEEDTAQTSEDEEESPGTSQDKDKK